MRFTVSASLRRSALRFLLLIGLVGATPLMAAEAETSRGAVTVDAQSPVDKAGLIRDLIAGELGVDIDPKALFSASVTSGEAARTRAVLRLLDDADLRKRARDDPKILDELTSDMAALAVAQAEFLSLPADRRKTLLEDHQKRVAASQRQVQAKKSGEMRLAQLERTAEALTRFLAGKAADPAALSIDFLDQQGPGAESARRKLLLDPPVDDDASSDTAAKQTVPERIAAAERRVDVLRGRLLSLSPEKLRDLQVKSGIVTDSADAIALANAARDEAERQQAEAQEAARIATSELTRLIATERARLLKVKAAQATYRAELARRSGAPTAIADDALGWRRKVSEIAARSPLDLDSERDADALYFQLVDKLQDVRGRLDDALAERAGGSQPGIMPKPIDSALRSDQTRDANLLRLHGALVDAAYRLEGDEKTQIWEERRALRSAMTLLNEARLKLIPELSPGMRERILGFGNEGIAQVKREISQISLDLRYNILSFNQHLVAATSPFLHPSPVFIFDLTRLLVLVFLFRWWRLHGGAMLQRWEIACLTRYPRSFMDSLQATVISYVRRVRRPLDWLLFVLLLRWLMPRDLVILGVDYIWIVAIWVLAAAFIIRLADELARGNRSNDPRAALRWKSLRLIAGILLGVGLVLALTDESVGKGAIYNWVLDACWLLAPPVIFLLAHWWRDRIVALSAAGAENSAFLAWNARNQDGIIGAFGRVAAGFVLLIEGLRAFIAGRASDIALIREIFDQRARARAAKQVAEDEASGLYRQLDEDLLAILDPHRLPAEARADGVRPGGLKLPKPEPGAVMAVIGERGLGKSAVLRDLGEAMTGARHVRLRVDRNGTAGIWSGLAKAFGVDQKMAGDPDRIAKIIQGNAQPVLITIDDVQRLIIPAIGGLAELDALIASVRSAGDQASWVLAMGGPAWSYVSRARHDRVMFDTIIKLPRWGGDDLRAMIERRTEQAGIQPDFSALVDYGAFQFDGDLDPIERKKRGYFDRLADYSNGNPAIALEFWRRSLFVRATSKTVVVRTYATPGTSKLTALPLSTMFVLRAILQMDIGFAPDIERSTDLTSIVVADALRSLLQSGVILPVDGGYRISLYWWSEIVRLLERQNLMVRDL